MLVARLYEFDVWNSAFANNWFYGKFVKTVHAKNYLNFCLILLHSFIDFSD